MYSENTAPNSATVDTIVAAMRKGDGTFAVETEDKSMSAIRMLESNTRSTSRGMTFFFAAIIKLQQFFV
jgi:hypothetical protein